MAEKLTETFCVSDKEESNVAMRCDKSAGHVIIPEGATGYGAFGGCRYLQSIVMINSIKKMLCIYLR